MAQYTGIFDLIDYTNQGGFWRLHFVARTPPPGAYSDVYLDIPESELPANINQGQLAAQLKTRLGWTANQTFAPLNQFLASGTTITLP
jgi:hypothetical protein